MLAMPNSPRSCSAPRKTIRRGDRQDVLQQTLCWQWGCVVVSASINADDEVVADDIGFGRLVARAEAVTKAPHVEQEGLRQVKHES